MLLYQHNPIFSEKMSCTVLFIDDENGDVAEETVSDYEKAILRTEFIEIMKQRFLDGKDSEFNYRWISFLQ